MIQVVVRNRDIVNIAFTATNYTDLLTKVGMVEGDLAIVYASQGVWPVNRRLKGVWIYQGATWEYANQETQNILAAKLDSVQGGTDITIDVTDPLNPIINFTGTIGGPGDMLKSVYDIGDNGIVDNSEALGGNSSAYHLDRTNHTGTQLAATISDFDIEVSNNTDVTNNSSKVSADGSVTTHSDVTDAGSGQIITNAERSAIGSAIQSSEKGIANGVATLDGTGKVPSIQLPSYVDDVLEFADLASFPITGEAGKIYVALDTGKTYRWSGAIYVEISPSDVNSVNGKTGVVTLNLDEILTQGNTPGANDIHMMAQQILFGIAPGADPSIRAVGTELLIDALASLYNIRLKAGAASTKIIIHGNGGINTGVVRLTIDNIIFTTLDVTHTVNRNISFPDNNGILALLSDLPIQATESIVGISERATQGETHTGSDDLRHITPLKLAGEKGVANGIASLDATGKVPATQLPNGDVTWYEANNSIVVTPANTLNNTIKTFTIPANKIGPNGLIEVYALWSNISNNANIKAATFTFGGNIMKSNSLASSTTASMKGMIGNASTGAQYGFAPLVTADFTPYGKATSGLLSFAVNTTLPVVVNINLQKTVAGDSVFLRNCFVRITKLSV